MEASMEEERDRFLPASSLSDSLLPLRQAERTDPALSEKFRDILLSKAFLLVPGPEYNKVSYEMRGEGSMKKLTFYEVVLLQEQEWAHLRDRIYPSLVRYLKAKSVHLKRPAGVIISLFYGDCFHLIEAVEFLQAYREIEGIDSAAFQWRVRQWLAG
jgi:hypothetical protein